MSGFSAVICGGGIAGVEALFRLHRLARSQVEITLICPNAELVYRPLTVLEPFTGEPPRRYPIAQLIEDTGARHVRDSLSWLDRTSQVAHTQGGAAIAYDALLLALGGREVADSSVGHVFTGREGGQAIRSVVDDVQSGRVPELAFVLPRGPVWPLPLYEIALMTAHRALENGHQPRLVFAIPGAKPLESFGGDAGERITKLLTEAGITLLTHTAAEASGPGKVVLRPSGMEIDADRTITLPRVTGPNVRGIPGFALDRFLHVDEYCRVLDTGGLLFAAGDATDLPVKHGSVAAQQADIAAAGIAHLAGVAPVPPRLRPRLYATLLTGGAPLYMSADLIDGQGWRARLDDNRPWPSDQKVLAEELDTYLRGADSRST